MATFGSACLILAFGVALFGVALSLAGIQRGRADWIASGRRSVFALAGLTTAAFVVLESMFLRNDFSNQVVATHSSTTTPLFYKAAAAWSSQEGSLLLWLLLLSLWSSLVLFLVRRRLRDVTPYATVVLLGLGAFFAGLLVFLEPPFATLPIAPSQGTGLNPLLRHPSMMIHPPMLYSGYTLFTIPFAFAIGALIVRRVDAEWIRSTRRFALAAWLFLGVGILLGARWSYAELGWGGYWAWDPVENASLMPWLIGTAFIHSIMIQEKRGMLKIWNVSLILGTGILCLLGTFLVRSGVLQSIHAFGASTLGIPFVILIGFLIFASVALVITRRDALRSEHRLDSLWSREAIFLANNLVFVSLCLVIWWGTFFPLISEAVTGDPASVGPPWFDRYVVPLTIVLVLLSGIAPLIAWRRSTMANARRNLLRPAVAAAIAFVVLLVLGAGERPWALAMFTVATFVLAAVFQEFWRGTVARRAMADESVPRAAVQLVRRNRRRYGGYLVHSGIAILFVGVAASTAFQDVVDTRLQVGETARVGDYDVTYVKPTADLVVSHNDLERIDIGAQVRVERDGELVTTMTPSRGFYPSQAIVRDGPVGRFFEGEATSEVGLQAGRLRDVWVAMTPDIQQLMPIVEEGNRVFTSAAGKLDPQLEGAALAQTLRGITTRYVDDPPPATFRMHISPLVSWMWIGAILAIIGGLTAVWPGGPDASVRRVRAGYAARVAQDLGRA
ncbi:MAG: heme lyase CcmF/NrfE family subunit [Solirubrobacteraceae bacterium]|nr:heme lyase CcmF/NrfE family subunit [Solirubrobacteraceae bacterium]